MLARTVLGDGVNVVVEEEEETLEKVSISTTFAQSRSRQPLNSRVSMGLGLNNFKKSESR